MPTRCLLSVVSMTTQIAGLALRPRFAFLSVSSCSTSDRRSLSRRETSQRILAGARGLTSFGVTLLLLCAVSVPLHAQMHAEKGVAFAGVPTTSGGTSATGLSSLPQDAQGPISAALGKDDSRYWAHANVGGFRAENPQHGLVADFTRHGAEVHSQSMRWGLEARAYGYGDGMLPVSSALPYANANRVEYRRDRVTEWYVNGPLGLEQGFTLAAPPGKANGQPLTVALALSGDLIASLEPGGTALKVTGKDGLAALRYTGLRARDATGRELRT